MSADGTAPASWRPIYDPHETLEQFTVRQRRAYAAFEGAWREDRVSVKLKGYYDQLVRIVGANAYAWWSEAAWAAEFGVSVSTIKRVLAALVKAGLIRRERQFAGTSHTYLTAYDPPTVNLDITEEVRVQVGVEDASQVGDSVNTDNYCFTPTSGESNNYQQSTPPSVWANAEPTFSSVLRSDSYKRQHLTPGGGGNPDPHPISHAVRAILEREGVSDFVVARRLQQLSWAELHAIQTYLNQQRNVHDRPRLFAWLATHGFGAQLLRGAQRQRMRNRAKPAALDPQRYVSGDLAPLIQGHAFDDAPLDLPRSPAPVRELTEPAVDPPPPALWPAVRAALRERCPTIEWTTWLEPTALLEVTDTTVVVGTPNVFARDAVRERYLPLLQATVQGCLGSARTVEVVIGSA